MNKVRIQPKHTVLYYWIELIMGSYWAAANVKWASAWPLAAHQERWNKLCLKMFCGFVHAQNQMQDTCLPTNDTPASPVYQAYIYSSSLLT